MPKQASSRPSYLLREFDRPLFIAAHFGFTPIEAPRIAKDADMPDESAFLRMYLEKEFAELSHPLALSYKRPAPNRKFSDYALHLLGFSSALAEALLIRAGLSILSDEGYEHLVVEVNSIGDKESIAAYERELHYCAKKIIADIPQEHRQLLKEDIFELLKLDIPEKARAQLPCSIASLSSPSRAHFKEMLEYLEALRIDFRLAHTLVGNRKFASQTIFAIRDASDESVLAEGSRYSRLTKHLGFKKELPAVGLTLRHNPKAEASAKKVYKDLPRPRFYLVQLGQEARMKALSLIELLRLNRIPVYHFLGKDKITAQLQTAENLRVPYLLIVGQKEALDNTVTIRNCSTRAQDTIGMNILPDYLRHIAL